MNSTPENLQQLINLFLNIFGIIIPILMGLAVLAFVWGIGKFILNSGNSASHAEGRNFMVWSIIALFILVTVWGIIIFAKNQFGFGGGVLIPLLPTETNQ